MALLHAPGDLYHEVAEAHRRRWTHADELAALTLEAIDQLRIDFAMAWSDPKKRPRKPPKPFRYPRPIDPPTPRRSTIREIAAFFRR